MAKFCTNCGKKLEDGKPCDCQKNKKDVVEAEVVKTSANDYVNDYIEALKGIFTKPVDTMKKYAKSSKFLISLIMLGINAIISALFVYLFAKESVGLVASLSGYGSLMKGYSIDIPVKVYFLAFLTMAVFFFCLGGLLHFVNSVIMKKDSDFKEIMSLIGVNSVFTTITTIIAIIALYINVWVAVIILAIAGVIFLLNIYHGYTMISNIDKNKMAYAFTGCYAITLFVVCYILPKIFY